MKCLDDSSSLSPHSTLPPAYSELSQTKSSHIRSMSDDVVATNNTRSSAGPGGVASQEGLATANGVTKANSQKEVGRGKIGVRKEYRIEVIEVCKVFTKKETKSLYSFWVWQCFHPTLRV